MKVRFTQNSLADLDEILDFVGVRSGQGAARIKSRILEVIAPLKRFPRIGTQTNDPNIRILVVSPYPYLIFYECDDLEKAVVIHHIRHAKRERDV